MIDFFTDLKSYFSQGSSGSSLSTHGSGVVAIVEDVPLEENVSPSVEHDEKEEQVQEGITDFNPDHIISDPRLRIPIERFYANIRDDIKTVIVVGHSAFCPFRVLPFRFPPPALLILCSAFPISSSRAQSIPMFCHHSIILIPPPRKAHSHSPVQPTPS
jgi:hypothetical protein